jgi:hypothetical protein
LLLLSQCADRYLLISVIPLVTVAFLLTYAHKYSWKILENNKALHISMMGLSVAIFLFIIDIFGQRQFDISRKMEYH